MTGPPTPMSPFLGRELSRLVEAVAAEIRPSASTPAGAFALLEPDVLGFTNVVHSEAALAAYEALLSFDPHSPEVLHHLAILHHARAFDLELGAMPSQSNRDWERALEYWHRLWNSEAFWERQTAQLASYEQGTEIVCQLRQSLPEKLMRVHSDIALDEQSRPQRVRFHVRMLRGAPFDESMKRKLLGEVYDKFMRVVPPEVWSEDATDANVLRAGLDPLEQYLEIDPESLVALSDALRLQVRMLYGWYRELDILPEDAVEPRKRLLETIRSSAEYWSDRLERLFLQLDELSSETRDQLALWFRVVGQAARESGRRQTAIDHFETALRAGGSDPQERQRCLDGLYLTKALLARDKARTQRSDALTECRELVAIAPCSPVTCYVLSNALLLLDEFDTAEKVCRDGLDEDRTPADFDPSVLELQRERLRDLLVAIAEARTRKAQEPELKAAEQDIQRSDWPAALNRLNKVLHQCPRDLNALLLRFRCQLQQYEIADAETDLAACRHIFEGDDDAHGVALIARLKEDVQECRGELVRWGREAARLQRRATAAFEAAQPAVAERLLREAMSHCLPAGRRELGVRLGTLIWNRAISALGTALEDPGTTTAQRLAACEIARQELRDVLKWDPQAECAVREIEVIEDLMKTLRAKQEAEAEHAARLREFGSEVALHLHDEAVEAWNAGRPTEALQKMRAAYRTTPSSQRIAQDLAVLLRGVAVALVNNRADNDRKALEAARDHLVEATKLHPTEEAFRADMSTVQRMLRETSLSSKGEY